MSDVSAAASGSNATSAEVQEILDWFADYDSRVQSGDLGGMADLAAFPLNEVTDDASGNAVVGACDRERYVAQMEQVVGSAGAVEMHSTRHPIFLSPALCFVVTDASFTVEGTTTQMRYGDLLVRTADGWKFQTMVAGGVARADVTQVTRLGPANRVGPKRVLENEDMVEATSAGDPASTVRLLWRHHLPPEPPKRGPRRMMDVDAVVDAATRIADAQGLDALSMRRLAERLALRPMSLYTYVPGRAELLDLMIDRAYDAMERPKYQASRWQTRVRAVAEQNLNLYRQHPWIARISTLRPPLGPGQLKKYDYELAAFTGSGLADLDVDDALTFLLSFVRGSALDMQASAASTQSDAKWWQVAGPLLLDVVERDSYPLAARIGEAAGSARASAHDPHHAYVFGLERVIFSLESLSHA